jgi:hypothetical protein
MPLAILPDQMAVGAQVSWMVQETIIPYYGGQIQTLLDWPYPKAEASFNTGVLDNDEYKVFLDMYETHGKGKPFLVKLRSRYQMTAESMSGTVGGGNMTFDIQETITSGDETVPRPVDYPDDATMSYLDGATPLVVDTRVKRTVTFTTAPAALPTATGDFRRLMRFKDAVSARVGNDERSGNVGQVRLEEMFEFE